MINGKDQLTKELSILYPDVTDIELNEMADDLIDFYTIAVKVILKNQEETKEFVVDDKNFSEQPLFLHNKG